MIPRPRAGQGPGRHRAVRAAQRARPWVVAADLRGGHAGDAGAVGGEPGEAPGVHEGREARLDLGRTRRGLLGELGEAAQRDERDRVGRSGRGRRDEMADLRRGVERAAREERSTEVRPGVLAPARERARDARLGGGGVVPEDERLALPRAVPEAPGPCPPPRGPAQPTARARSAAAATATRRGGRTIIERPFRRPPERCGPSARTRDRSAQRDRGRRGSPPPRPAPS